MNIVFFGTPEFGVTALQELCGEHRVLAIVTQPDKPRGRHGQPQPSAIKIKAREIGIPILQPEALVEASFMAALTSFRADAIVVAAYGKIIPKEILALPLYGCINIHGSLLPKYRGAAPIQRAIMDGVMTTGVTIMQMDEGMDTGDILRTEAVAVSPEDDSGSVTKKLSLVGAGLLLKTLSDIEVGGVEPRPQSSINEHPSYAPPLRKEEREIDWRRPAADIVNLVRALAPAPGAHSHWRGKRLKILRAKWANVSLSPGEFSISDETILVGAGDGAVELLLTQPEGKRVITAAEFVRGYRPGTGGLLGKERPA